MDYTLGRAYYGKQNKARDSPAQGYGSDARSRGRRWEKKKHQDAAKSKESSEKLRTEETLLSSQKAGVHKHHQKVQNRNARSLRYIKIQTKRRHRKQIRPTQVLRKISVSSGRFHVHQARSTWADAATKSDRDIAALFQQDILNTDRPLVDKDGSTALASMLILERSLSKQLAFSSSAVVGTLHEAIQTFQTTLAELEAATMIHGSAKPATLSKFSFSRSSEKHHEAFKEIEKRKRLIAWLIRSREVFKRRASLMHYLGHERRKFILHTRIKMARWHTASQALQLSRIILRDRAVKVQSTARDIVEDIETLANPIPHPILQNGGPTPAEANRAQFHQSLAERLSRHTILERVVALSASRIMDIALLENSHLGDARVRLIMMPLYRIFSDLTQWRALLSRQYQELISGLAISDKKLYPPETLEKLSQIPGYFTAVTTTVYTETQAMLESFRNSLECTVRDIDESGELLPYAPLIRARILDSLRESLVSDLPRTRAALAPYGYKPSKWLMDLYVKSRRHENQSATPRRQRMKQKPSVQNKHSPKPSNAPHSISKKRKKELAELAKKLIAKGAATESTHIRCRNLNKLNNGSFKAGTVTDSPNTSIVTIIKSPKCSGLSHPKPYHHENARKKPHLQPISWLQTTAKPDPDKGLCLSKVPKNSTVKTPRVPAMPKTTSALSRACVILSLGGSPAGRAGKASSKRHAPALSRRVGICFTQSRRMQAPHTPLCASDPRMPGLRPVNTNHSVSQLGRRDITSVTASQSFRGTGYVNGSSGREPNSAKNNPSGDGDDHSRTNTPEKPSRHPPSNNITQDMPAAKSYRDRDDGNESDSCSEGGSESEVENSPTRHIPLSYQIPPIILRTAMSASPNSAGSFYSQGLYRGPEDELISIHYCHNMEIAERVAKYFLDEKIIGFDIEWKPFAAPQSIKDNTSLIQLACEDRIALFHIALYTGSTADELLPPTLRTIIESQDVCKVGVAIKGDFSRLEKYLNVKPLGVFELSRLHNLVENSATNPEKAGSRKLFSLAKQVQQHLQLPLFKGAVRESDWTQRLSYEQITYAATDAYAGFRIFDALESKRKLLKPIPPLPDLCDFDSAPRLRTAQRTRPARKAVIVSEREQDTRTAIVATESEEDTEAYQTAAEEFMDSRELEASSESEASTESASQSDDPDADYVPTQQRRGRAPNLADQGNGPSYTRPYTRRVSHLNVSAVADPDPGYPLLPQISSERDSDAELDPIFDPPATFSNRRVDKAVAVVEHSPSDVDVEMEDCEERDDLGRRVSSMEIGETYKYTKGSTSKSTPKSKDTSIQKAETMGSLSSNAGPLVSANDPFAFKPLQPDAHPKSPEYTQAENWAQSYLFQTIPPPSVTPSPPSRIRATVPHLRAYHLWHHQRLPLNTIAAHLRSPPLAETTVSNYVVQAVVLEKLDYKNEDMRVVLRALPKALRMTRWKWMVEKVGGV